MKEKNVKKNFIWNMIGVTLNSFNSMFFMVIITRINGTENAGVFTLLFSIVNLLYNIGIYSGRTFQVTDNTKKFNNAEYVLHRGITVFVMFLIAAVYCTLKQFDIYRFLLTMLLTIMKAMEAFCDVLYGIEQKNDELYKSGISLTAKSLFSLISLIIIDLFFHNLIIAFVVVNILCFVITIIYDIPNTKCYLIEKASIKSAIRLFPAGFYAFAYFFLNVYLANAPKYALADMVSNSKQALFSIVLMPATLINLFSIYLLQPYINRMGLLYSENRFSEFKKTMKIILYVIIGIGIVAEIVASTIAIPILNMVYSVNLSNYLFSLQLIVLGATFVATVTVFSTALTTFRNTKDQFYIYIVISVVIYLLSGILVKLFDVQGAAYLYLLSTVLQFLLYYLDYKKHMKNWLNSIRK